jgi:hypothetical protein
MSDDPNDPQASEPPTNTGGGGNVPLSDLSPDEEAQMASEPPTNTGGGGGSD